MQIAVRIMGMDDKLHLKMFEDNLALIDTPLIASATSTHYPGTVSTSLHSLHGILLYPFNVSDFQPRHTAPAGHESSALDVIDTGKSYGYETANGHSGGGGHGHSHSGGGVYYQSMCKCLTNQNANKKYEIEYQCIPRTRKKKRKIGKILQKVCTKKHNIIVEVGQRLEFSRSEFLAKPLCLLYH